MTQEDSELMKQALMGDPKAFTYLVKRYQDAVYGLAFHMVGNFEDAQDLTQDAFIKAYQNLDQLKPPFNFAAWLRRITINECMSWLRSRKKDLVLGDLSSQGEAIGSGMIETPEEELERKELFKVVMDAINSLSEKNRLAATLFYIDGYTSEEIGRFLGLPATTVRTRIRRARDQLRNRMTEMVEELFEEYKLPEGFTEKVLEEAIGSAKKAERELAYGDVLKSCDKALEILDRLDVSTEHKRSMMDVLQMKGRAVEFVRSYEEGIKHYKGSLKVGEDIGDKVGQVAALCFMGRAYANSGDPEKPFECYEKALEISTEIGFAQGRADSLESLGTAYYFIDDCGKALDYFKRALEGSREIGNRRMETYSIAAIELLSQVGGTDSIRVSASGCFIFERKPSSLILAAADTMSRGQYEPVPMGTVFRYLNRKVLMFSKSVRGRWSDNVRPYGYERLKATTKVESDRGVACVPAGTFRGCLRTRTLIRRDRRRTPASVPQDRRNDFICGTRDVWFAPGVGLVKLECRHEDGTKTEVELVGYSISKGCDDYFPLQIGNQWQYEWTGGYRDRMREMNKVVAQDDDGYYLTCVNYRIDS